MTPRLGSTPTRAASRTLAAGVLTLVLAVTTACAGAGPDPSPGGASSSASTPSSGDETATPSETSDPAETSESASPDGSGETEEFSPPSFRSQTIRQRGLAVEVPAAWLVDRSPRGRYVGAVGPGPDSLTLNKFDVVDQTGAGDSTDRAAEIALGVPSIVRDPTRLDDVELLGVPMFHLRGPINSVFAMESYGGFVGDQYVELRLDQQLDKPAAKRQQLMDEIVATLREVG